MHIMQMLGGISLVFLFALFLMCLFCDRLKSPLVNALLIISCAIFMFAWTFAMYEHNGLKNGFMTLDNISPFICTVIPLTPFMSKKTKDFARCAIAYLAFGMFVAMFVSPEVEYIFNYHQEAKFIHVSEAACHMAMGLYGFYLFLSGRVKICTKSCLKAMGFIYSAIGFGMFLNYFFHRSFFGMNFYGEHSIYFMDIFNSFEATLVAYLVGVFVTILLGSITGSFLVWLSRNLAEKQN